MGYANKSEASFRAHLAAVIAKAIKNDITVEKGEYELTRETGTHLHVKRGELTLSIVVGRFKK